MDFPTRRFYEYSKIHTVDIMSSLKTFLEDKGLMFPNYKNSSMEVFNEFASGSGKLIGNNERKLLLLLDGLGFDLFNECLEKNKELSNAFKSAEISKISTIFPSFTPVVLTSLESGLSVAEHGIVGSELPVREYAKFINIFDVGWGNAEKDLKIKEAELLFPEMHNLEKLVNTQRFSYLQDEVVFRKNQDTMLYKKLGKKLRTYVSQRDFFIQLRKLLRNTHDNNIYGYLDKVDHASHVYSKNSEEVKELTTYLLKDIVEYLLPIVKENNWELIITSDHGQRTFSKEHLTTVRGTDAMLSYLNMIPWGCSLENVR